MPKRRARLRAQFFTMKEDVKTGFTRFTRLMASELNWHPVNLVEYLYGMHQRRPHGCTRFPTFASVFGEGAFDHFSDAFRNVGSALAQRNYLTLKYRLNRSGNVVIRPEIQRRITGQKAVGRHANRVDVRSRTHVAKVSDLFRWHVGESSGHVAGHRDAAHA